MAPLDTDIRSVPLAGDQVPDVPTGRPVPSGGPVPVDTAGWTPLAGRALLDRLRVTGRPRPLADPDRVDRLRRSIEDRIGPLAGTPGHPLVVTKGSLTRALSCDAHREPAGFDDQPFSLPLAVGALVDVLFRQLVTTGSLGDPMTDGLDALRVDDRQVDLLRWIEQLPYGDRRALAGEVRRQATGLVERWPALDPAWLPRTEESMRVALAGGSVELAARVDLAVGRPDLDVASVGIVEVKSGSRRPEHRLDLGFYALVEALRRSAPPFVVATYYTRSGELDVEPVDDELLAAAARRTVAGVRAMERGAARGGGGGDPAACAGCASQVRFDR